MTFLPLLILISLVCVIALTFYIIVIIVAEYHNPLRCIPGPLMKDPIFGVFHAVVFHGVNPFTLAKQAVTRRLYGTLRKSHIFFGQIRIEVADSDFVNYILVQNFKNFIRGNFSGVELIHIVLGPTSLILTDGDLHKRHRKCVASAFKPSLLKTFVPIMAECVDRLRVKWASKKSPTIVADIKGDLGDLTLDIIALVAFGYDFHAVENRTKFVTAVHQMFEGKIRSGGSLPGYMTLCNFLYKISYKPWLNLGIFKFFHNLRELHNIVDKVVKERKTTRNLSEKPRNVLDLVLSANESGNLSDSELQSFIMSIMAAGHETASTCLSWTLLLLSQHKNIQEKCRGEAKFQLRDLSPAEITSEVIESMKFVNCVIHESLRLYPPAAHLIRSNLSEEMLGKYRIPPGTDCLLMIGDLHRNPEYWGMDANDFRPDRFENFDSVPWHCYKPFGDGIHKCLGYQLAQIELPLILALLLSTFEFNLVDGDQFEDWPAVTLNIQPTLRLQVSRLL